MWLERWETGPPQPETWKLRSCPPMGRFRIAGTGVQPHALQWCGTHAMKKAHWSCNTDHATLAPPHHKPMPVSSPSLPACWHSSCLEFHIGHKLCELTSRLAQGLPMHSSYYCLSSPFRVNTSVKKSLVPKPVWIKDWSLLVGFK